LRVSSELSGGAAPVAQSRAGKVAVSDRDVAVALLCQSYMRTGSAEAAKHQKDHGDRNSATTAGSQTSEAAEVLDDADPDWVTATKQTLGTIVNTPVMNTSSLSKPTVTFLRDVFQAVAQETQCGAGLFEAEEMSAVTEECNAEIKRTFLHKLVDFVVSVTETDLDFPVNDFLAGKCDKQANILMQRLHVAATEEAAKTRWSAGVKLACANNEVRTKDDQITTLKTEVAATQAEAAEGGCARPKSPAGSAINAIRALAEEKQADGS